LALTVPNLSTIEGTKIQQIQFEGDLNQEWTVYLGAGLVGNGNYVNVGFQNAYSGQWLDNPQSSQSNGAKIILWPLDYGANQKWTLLAASDSYPVQTVYITNTATRNPLLGEYTAWTLVPLADNYFLFVNASTGEVLDDPDFTLSAAVIQQYQLNGGLNQQWDIGDAGNVDGVEAGQLIYNAFSNLVLDDPTGDSTSLIQDRDDDPFSLTQCWLISTSWPYPAY
jgi:hypothetical protein